MPLFYKKKWKAELWNGPRAGRFYVLPKYADELIFPAETPEEFKRPDVTYVYQFYFQRWGTDILVYRFEREEIKGVPL